MHEAYVLNLIAEKGIGTTTRRCETEEVVVGEYVLVLRSGGRRVSASQESNGQQQLL